jgi:hypothetical protein
MLIPVRRIVTTDSAEGRSRVLLDGPSPHTVSSGVGRGLTNLWITDPPRPSNAGTRDAAARPVKLEPPEGGSIFRFFQVAPEPKPGTLTPEEREARAAAAFAAMNASHIRVDTTRHPGMHKSRTTDYIILLKGRVRLLLDDEERDLEPFDVVVQRGTNHAWVNLEDEPALLVAVLLDASNDAGQP